MGQQCHYNTPQNKQQPPASSTASLVHKPVSPTVPKMSFYSGVVQIKTQTRSWHYIWLLGLVITGFFVCLPAFFKFLTRVEIPSLACRRPHISDACLLPGAGFFITVLSLDDYKNFKTTGRNKEISRRMLQDKTEVLFCFVL